MDGQHLVRERRAARNQALFRSVNERIEELSKAFDAFTPYGTWMCECAWLDCVEQVQMTLAEYEGVRRRSEWFVVAPGEAHVDPEVERVVERNERYWLVEKLGVVAAETARVLDERSG